MSAEHNPRPRGRPPSRSLDDVVKAAVACIRKDGLDALTIRAVAERLGSSPMALYRHVADRDELVARSIDHVVSKIELPPHPTRARDRGPWLTDMAVAARAVLIRYPGVAEQLLVMGPTGEHGYEMMDRICHVLADTGREPEEVAFAYTWLMVTVAAYSARHTRGGAVAARAGVAHAELRTLFVRRTSPYAERYPYLAATARSFTTDPDRSYADAITHVVTELLRHPGRS